MTALLLWNCTDYAGDWENSYGAIFGSGGRESYGQMVDSRDGKKYRTIQVGNQVWMAENLNYETIESYCYGNDASNCTKYGRLYRWSAAMDSAGTFSANGKGCGSGSTCSATLPVQGVCPTGWHLPSESEFRFLLDAVGGEYVAGNVLKSRSGWSENRNGTNAYAFSALPAGYRSHDGSFDGEGYYAYFWSSTEYNSYGADNMYLYYNDDGAFLGNGYYKNDGASVRCVKD